MIVGLVTEYCGVTLDNVSKITHSIRDQALKALDAIHSQDIIHGDIRLANLVTNDNGRFV